MSIRALPLLIVLVACPLAFAVSKEDEAKKHAGNLTNKDAKVRATAATELGKLGQLQKRFAAPYIPDLMKVLTDSDAKVRAEAARALGLIDPEDKKEAITKVSEILKSEKSEVARGGQEMSLGELGATAEDEDLKKMARDALLEARKKADGKAEQKVIQAAMQLITGPKKKN